MSVYLKINLDAKYIFYTKIIIYETNMWSNVKRVIDAKYFIILTSACDICLSIMGDRSFFYASTSDPTLVRFSQLYSLFVNDQKVYLHFVI